MSIYGLFASPGPNGFGYNTTAEQVTEGLSLAGKTILVTGCNSGLGYETMRVLAMRGAEVVGTGRTEEKAKQACDSIGGRTVPVGCELSDPASIHACIETLKRKGSKFDAIVCNAGIMSLPKVELVHGFEKQFFTNHVGHFLLVTGLLDRLGESGRVVVLSSGLHKRAPQEGIRFDNLDGSKQYDGWGAYGQSKFANVLFAKELARRFRGTRRTANAVHPGVIRTNLGRYQNAFMNGVFAAFGPLFLKNVPQGAATEVFAAVSPKAEGVNGQYLADCNVAAARPDTDDEGLAQKLWDLSEQIARDVMPAGASRRGVDGAAHP